MMRGLYIFSCSARAQTLDSRRLEPKKPDSLLSVAQHSKGTPTFRGVLAQHPMKITASGGTGAYLFSLQNQDTTSIVNETTGAFLASDQVGTQEIIKVNDAGCDGSATVTLDIFDTITVLPHKLTLQPDMTFSPNISGGSGDYSCTLVLGPSGSSLDECAYTAGRNIGADLVRIQDQQTGYAVDVPINVHPDTGLEDLISVVLLPVGATYTPEASGGSGQFDYTVLSGDIALRDGVLTAETPGTSVVNIQDRFVPSFTAEITIVASAALSPELPADGESVHFAEAVGAGDLDGDGQDEAILSVYSGSYNAYYGGLVSVYTADTSGIDPTPPYKPSEVPIHLANMVVLWPSETSMGMGTMIWQSVPPRDQTIPLTDLCRSYRQRGWNLQRMPHKCFDRTITTTDSVHLLRPVT